MIYFVQEVGLLRNRVKIGFTNNLRDRLDNLRTASPSDLKVLLVLSGDMQTERAYHERFAQYRLHGEWFKFGMKLRLFVYRNLASLTPYEVETIIDEEGDLEIIEFNVNIIEDDFLRQRNIKLPSGITRSQLVEWAQLILARTKTPAYANWTGAGNPFSRDNYTAFVNAMIEARILITLPGKGTQLTEYGEQALKDILNIQE